MEKLERVNIISLSHKLSWLTVADPGFSPGGAPTPKIAIIFQMFAKNCMKMKEFGPPVGARVPGAPLDPPMAYTIKCKDVSLLIKMTALSHSEFNEILCWR